MKIVSTICLFVSLIILSSCSSINKSHMNSSIGISVEGPLKANIEVDVTKKLTGYAYGGFLFHFFKVSGDNRYIDGVDFNPHDDRWFTLGNAKMVKAAATYNALRGSKADLLVSPQYTVEESGWNPFYKVVKVKVVGYPGRVTSIKTKE
jgi:hypothetical protein